MSNLPAVIETDFDTLQRMSLALYKSGYFKDVKSEAQAIVKVMAGAELGLPAFASMSGIHIIQNKPVLGANVIATLVKNDPRYDYRPTQADDKACLIDWYENGTLVGAAGFSMVEAKTAGLAGKDNWKKYPSDMLFARAISRGARRFAPGIFGGAPVYTPDEMGADVDEEGYIIEGELTEVKQTEDEPAPEPPAETEQEREQRVNDVLGLDKSQEAKAQANTGDNGVDWWREKVATGRNMTLRTVCSISANGIAYYKAEQHAFNALADENSPYPFPDGIEHNLNQRVSNEEGLDIYDWLQERAAKKADEEAA